MGRKADLARARAERRDRLAEEWLIARHAKDWYIGNAMMDEWAAAYEAVDKALAQGERLDGSEGGSDGPR